MKRNRGDTKSVNSNEDVKKVELTKSIPNRWDKDSGLVLFTRSLGRLSAFDRWSSWREYRRDISWCFCFITF